MDLKIVKVSKTEPEYLVLQVERDHNLWPYILFDTAYDGEGNVTNKNRHSFLFPNLNVKKGDFVIVYTKVGESKSFRNTAGTVTHELYWGLDVNVWNHAKDEVLLVHVDDYKRTKL